MADGISMSFGCFGKLPLSREFLVDGGRDLTDTRFDRWMGEVVGLSKARLGSRFDDRITAFPRLRFIWAGGNGSKVLAGQMVPSEDGAGRKHPFSVFAAVDGRRAAELGVVAAVALHEAQEEAARLVGALAGAAQPAQVAETLRRSALALEAGGKSAGARYQQFVDETPGAAFWAGVFGEESSPSRYQVMQALCETIDPLRGRQPRDIRIGLRCPVSAGDALRSACEAAFWLDLVSRRLRKPLERSSCFWAETPNGGRADFHLFFSEPSGAQGTCLIDRGIDVESISFLDRPYGSDPASRMEASLKRLLESPEAGLGEYLAWAGA